MLIVTPALINHTESVEKTKSIGRPDENPKQSIFNGFSLIKIEISFFKLISPKRR